ncbi:UDP-N-acetyl-D-glucosamine 2-epimerase, UDP-hydrolysing [Thermanaerovibrio velox DSM 12556]|uniref:UDP-N-acetyl-D-glucosamine 2-epimerase, UDP-hydrolysing n=1 Tax=Thermanaerovibrio velox DSM 12556 TaxID=926567 RepID=H0UMT9_9BACT|nr:UDP-N-acetyl-D-glucosamine 2-epimerase, UDP-hydrolysing [Thermanaerovibrio velox DSM 12556]
MPRKIAVMTGSRAEYGLLYWLIRGIADDPDLELKLLVAGMHLSPEFGNTWMEIQRDGFEIAAKVEMLLSSDSPVGIAKSTGLGVIGFADALELIKPDILVILGDRFEALAAAVAAHILRIPVAHIHGGECTYGAMDDAFRHSITKLSQLHFVAAESYRQRVIQMGEHPNRVFLTGSPGLDHLEHISYLSAQELESDLGIGLSHPVFLVTYHPVTLHGSPETAFASLLRALDGFPEASIVFTYPNADTHGRVIVRMLEDYVSRHPERARAVASLGQRRYLSLLKHCDVVIGNSSSGITEAPSFGVPTVNIGDRQRGRLRAASVIDCEEDEGAIRGAIQRALSPEFRNSALRADNPYGKLGASRRIIKILKEFPLEGILEKGFFDLPLTADYR